MIHDMEPFSHFEEPFDPVDILSGHPNPDYYVDGQILNMIVPQGLQGEVYSSIGDHFTYCISSATPKRFGDLKYSANSCQVKFKLRAVASFNKLPGFPKFSGYKQMNMLGPGMLATHGQVAHILDRMTEAFPDFKDTRKQYLSQHPPSTMGLSKESLFIKMVEGSTRRERLHV